MSSSARPVVTRFAIDGYRAFARAEMTLGRLTVILGRNNAGKSALCFAPYYFAQAFRSGAPAPLPVGETTAGFGSPHQAIFRRLPIGMGARFELADTKTIKTVDFGVTVLEERSYAQQITRFELTSTESVLARTELADWAQIKTHIQRHDELPALTNEIGVLRGVRPLPDRDHPQLGYTPPHVGSSGESAPAILFSAGEDGLAAVNDWFQKIQARLSIDTREDRYELLATGTAGQPVNIVASGAGIAQALPLVVQLTLAEKMPRLWCVEQPELHLHPAAHPLVAELFLDRLRRDPGARFLIETHSDALVLRLRREVAAGRLAPNDLRIYFVDERRDPHAGSTVREIELTGEGSPTWWPEGVFAEPEREYFAIRRELQRRRARAD